MNVFARLVETVGLGKQFEDETVIGRVGAKEEIGSKQQENGGPRK